MRNLFLEEVAKECRTGLEAVFDKGYLLRLISAVLGRLRENRVLL